MLRKETVMPRKDNKAGDGRQNGGSRGDQPSSLLDSTVTNGTKFWIETKEGLIPVQYSFIKVVRTNNMIEIFEAEKPFILDRKPVQSNKPSKEKKSEQREKEYRYRTAKRAMDTIRRLAMGNFKSDEIKHLTLTFKDGLEFDIKDISVCNKEFSKFLKKLRRKYGDLKYIKVAEFQDKNNRGAVHYHVMINLPYVDAQILDEIWGNGFITIRKREDIAKYLFKYLLKNAGDKRFKGKRSWSHSKNLTSPKVYYQQTAYAIRRDLCERNLAPNHSYSYKSDFNDMMHVCEYDLDNPIPRTTAKPIKPILPKKDSNDRK